MQNTVSLFWAEARNEGPIAWRDAYESAWGKCSLIKWVDRSCFSCSFRRLQRSVQETPPRLAHHCPYGRPSTLTWSPPCRMAGCHRDLERDLFSWMDNFSLGGKPSTSPALCTPCSLTLLPGSWLGSGEERTVSVPVGPGQALGLCQGLCAVLWRWGACGAAVLSTAALKVA